jgi:hypothetical protein
MTIARVFAGTMLSFGAVVMIGVALLTATGVVGWQSTPQRATVHVHYVR